jgi:protein-S-isoprenylcysteine O-methyltransferase Ste14
MLRLCGLVFSSRNVLAGLPLVYALVSARGEWEDDAAVWSLAILACSVGVALRTWSVVHNRYAQGDRKSLTTTGPYAFVRNPLYIGNLAILAGATIASELAWLLPATLAWAFLVYSLAIVHEEHRLFARYGDDYLRYRRQVPAWIPRFDIVLIRQARAYLLLLPFLLKELKLFDLWPL